MKSCMSAKYYHYTIIIKHIKVTVSCKLNGWRMTVLHSTRGDDGKGTTSVERAGMDTTTEQVGLMGWAAGGLALAPQGNFLKGPNSLK